MVVPETGMVREEGRSVTHDLPRQDSTHHSISHMLTCKEWVTGKRLEIERSRTGSAIWEVRKNGDGGPGDEETNTRRKEDEVG